MLNMSKKSKIAIGIVGTILLAAIVFLLYVGQQYKARIKAEIPKSVQKASKGLYRISFDKVHINLFTRSISLTNVSISIDSNKLKERINDSTLPPYCINMRVKKLKASGIYLRGLSTEMECEVISIVEPYLSVTKNDKALSGNFAKTKNENKYRIAANVVSMVSGKLEYYYRKDNKLRNFDLSNINIRLDDWDTYNADNSNNFLLARSGNINVARLVFNGEDLDYHLSIDEINFNSSGKKLNARDLKLNLASTQEHFYEKWGVQKEIYDLHLPTIEVNDIDWKRLFNKKELFASTIYLNQSKLMVLFNRQLPPNPASKMGNHPNQMLMKLKLPVYIEDIRMNNGDITYTEISKRSGMEGSIYFTKLDGRIDNITNIDSLVEKDDICNISIHGKFNKFTDISAAFELKLNDKKGSFKVNTTLEGLSGHQISTQTQIFTLIAVKSMNMQRLKMELEGNEDYAQSNFVMLYHNLSIKITKEANDAQKEKRKKSFMTFIANNLILYSNNPQRGSKEPRVVQTYIKRDPQKSFFNLIWRNIHQGVQESTIRDMNVIRWMRKLDKKSDNNNATSRRNKKKRQR